MGQSRARAGRKRTVKHHVANRKKISLKKKQRDLKYGRRSKFQGGTERGVEKKKGGGERVTRQTRVIVCIGASVIMGNRKWGGGGGGGGAGASGPAGLGSEGDSSATWSKRSSKKGWGRTLPIGSRKSSDDDLIRGPRGEQTYQFRFGQKEHDWKMLTIPWQGLLCITMR